MKEQEPRQNGKKRKPIPIISYLCGLLAVAVLFTGTTFSRYSTQISGDVQTNLSPFVASYTIQDISSTNFPNLDYWLAVEASENRPLSVARTVRFTISNQNESGRVSGVDLQASLRFRVPAELGDNLVLQVEEVRSEGGQTVSVPLTPQYIIGNLVYETKQATSTSEYEYDLKTDGSRKFRATGTQLNTRYFADYSARGDVNENLTLTGGLDGETGVGTIMAEAPDTKDKDGKTIKGNRISVTSAIVETEYSIGYQRGKTDSDYQSELFVDLVGEHRYYTIDITLPEMFLDAEVEGKRAVQSRTFVLYVTLAEMIDFDGDSESNSGGNSESNSEGNSGGQTQTRDWSNGNTNYDNILTAPGTGTDSENYKINGDTVVGYHFDVQAQTYDKDEKDRKSTEQVRVVRRYGYEIEERGGEKVVRYTGNNTLSFQHVAPLTTEDLAQAALYAHPIIIYDSIQDAVEGAGTKDGSAYVGSAADINGTDAAYYGVCSNYGNLTQKYMILLTGLPQDPRYAVYLDTYDGIQQNYFMYDELSRKYDAQLTMLFVQASESGEVSA